MTDRRIDGLDLVEGVFARQFEVYGTEFAFPVACGQPAGLRDLTEPADRGKD